MIIVLELLGKIIYLCNKLLKKLNFKKIFMIENIYDWKYLWLRNYFSM